MSSNAGASAFCLCDEVGRDTGLEKLGGGLDGGDDGMVLSDRVGSQPEASAVSVEVACGELGKKGPSNAFAGDSDRLPGMVSSPPRVRTVGDDESTAARISR